VAETTGAGAALAWARTTMNAIARLEERCYISVAPVNAALPMAVVSVVGSRDVRVAGSVSRQVEEIDIQVDIYDRQDAFESVQTIAYWADAVMESLSVRQAGPEAKGYRVYEAVRQSQVLMLEPDESGERLTRQSQVYRLRLQPL